MPESRFAALGPSSRPPEYRNLIQKEYETARIDFGLPAPHAAILPDAAAEAARGELDSTARDLYTLINRRTTTLADAIEAAIKS